MITVIIIRKVQKGREIPFFKSTTAGMSVCTKAEIPDGIFLEIKTIYVFFLVSMAFVCVKYLDTFAGARMFRSGDGMLLRAMRTYERQGGLTKARKEFKEVVTTRGADQAMQPSSTAATGKTTLSATCWKLCSACKATPMPAA